MLMTLKPILCLVGLQVTEIITMHDSACVSLTFGIHISISATSIKRPGITGRLQSIELKRDVFNQYNLITLMAIELNHTTIIDLKLD